VTGKASISIAGRYQSCAPTSPPRLAASGISCTIYGWRLQVMNQSTLSFVAFPGTMRLRIPSLILLVVVGARSSLRVLRSLRASGLQAEGRGLFDAVTEPRSSK